MKKSIKLITSITAVMAAAVMSVSAFAENNAAVSTTITYIDGVVCGGNINITDLNTLMGTNVIDVSQLGINNTICGGNININKIHDIDGTNITYGDINQITGTVTAGDLNLNGMLFTDGNYEQLKAQTQNILGNDYFGGGINVNNIIK